MKKNCIYLSGGREKITAQFKTEAEQYAAGLILELDLDSGAVRQCVEHKTDQTFMALDGSILFKSGTLTEEKLYVCTQTEVLVYNRQTWKLERLLSHRSFNDLHHVLPISEREILVANTGLDRIQKFDVKGNLLQEWPVIDERLWGGRFKEEIDYRKVLSTKPHLSHPNYCFLNEGEYWVTRFEQRDAICLTDPTRLPLNVGVERPHDGVPRGDRVAFTTVDGHLVFSQTKGGTPEIINLNDYYKGDSPLGWCRGLYFQNDYVWVGFSRLRPTKIMKNLSWIKHGFKTVGIYGMRPTRIACFDLTNKKLVREVNLEDHGMHAVFGIMGDES